MSVTRLTDTETAVLEALAASLSKDAIQHPERGEAGEALRKALTLMMVPPAEERHAWDLYAAALNAAVDPSGFALDVEEAAEAADTLLAERRKRFGAAR
jgi:hypothetical protein